MKVFAPISLLLLIKAVRSLTEWFSFGSPGFPMEQMVLSGPNQEYCVQGRGKYASYSIDWNSGTAVLQGETIIIQPYTVGDRTQGDDTYNIVLSGRAIYRFNVNPTTPPNLEQYPVQAGPFYFTPFWATGTAFMFVSALNGNELNNFFRLQSDRITGVKFFAIGGFTRAYVVLYGTGWLIVSLRTSNERKLFDYTNGYVGGSNSSIITQTRTKV